METVENKDLLTKAGVKPAANQSGAPNKKVPKILQKDPEISREELAKRLAIVEAQKNKLEKELSDRRPKIDVFSADGFKERRKRAVSLNISEQMLPPLTRNVTAKYRLIASERIDPATGKPPQPTDLDMPGTYMLYDPFEPDLIKKQKLIRNLGRPNITRDAVSKKEVIEDTIETVQFVAGLKEVNIASQYNLYVFLELHPLNGSNKFRPRGKDDPMFERIDIKTNRSDMTLSAEMDLALEAEKWVVEKIKDTNEIIGMAVTAKVFQQGFGVGECKTALRAWARTHPSELFKMTKNIIPSIQLDIMSAIDLGMIEHSHDTRTFKLLETGQDLFVYAPGENPIEALVIDLYKESSSANEDEKSKTRLNVIQHLLNYWEPSAA